MSTEAPFEARLLAPPKSGALFALDPALPGGRVMPVNPAAEDGERHRIEPAHLALQHLNLAQRSPLRRGGELKVEKAELAVADEFEFEGFHLLLTERPPKKFQAGT